jgi:hypothetical protein
MIILIQYNCLQGSIIKITNNITRDILPSNSHVIKVIHRYFVLLHLHYHSSAALTRLVWMDLSIFHQIPATPGVTRSMSSNVGASFFSGWSSIFLLATFSAYLTDARLLSNCSCPSRYIEFFSKKQERRKRR